MVSDYQKENNELATNMIRKRFYRAFKGERFPGGENLRQLELIIDRKCNLACKYCYYDKFSDQYFTKESIDKETIIKNVKMIGDWLVKEGMRPDLSLFSADIMFRDIIFDLADALAPFLKENNVVVPTNASFIADDKQFEKVEALIDKYPNLQLSLSIEGKYCEHSRPYLGKKKEDRDDAYYERAFDFAKRRGYGFHPMIHSSNIRDWKKNLIWYLEMLKKYDVPPKGLYLLEVRNNDWSNEDLLEYKEFMKFSIVHIFEKLCNGKYDAFRKLIINEGTFNYIGSIFVNTGRGMGCSIQSMLDIRVGDMAVFPCHRLAYKYFEIGKLKLPEFEMYDVKKPELMIGIDSLESSNMPKCDYCIINKLCSSGCLGQFFEESYDMFYPNPQVCRLLHMKILGTIEGLIEAGIFNNIVSDIRPDKADQLINFAKLFIKQ